MTNRDTFQSSVKSAQTTAKNSKDGAITVFQATIDAQNSVVGYNNVSGNYANLATAVKNANLAKLEAFANAEKVKQAAEAVARDVLKDSGDKGPA